MKGRTPDTLSALCLVNPIQNFRKLLPLRRVSLCQTGA